MTTSVTSYTIQELGGCCYKVIYELDDYTSYSLFFKTDDIKNMQQFVSDLIKGQDTIWNINTTTSFKVTDGIYSHTGDDCANCISESDGKTEGPFTTRLNDVIVNAWKHALHYALLPIAQYVGPGLTWQCPRCKRDNAHTLPCCRRSMNDMFLSSRCCDGCYSDYKLGRPSILSFQSSPKDSDNEQKINKS